MSDLPATRTHAELEAIVERGLSTFVDVGNALAEIRDGRTYRETHGDFDSYCRERWGMSKRHANRQIEAAAVVLQVGPIGPPPANEAQARELAAVPEPERPAAWQAATERAAVEDRPVTAADVRAVVAPPAPSVPESLPVVPDQTNPMDAVVTGDKALLRISEGLAWIRRAGGPGTLVDGARSAPTASFTLGGWRHDVARFRAALDEFDAALNEAGGLRRIK